MWAHLPTTTFILYVRLLCFCPLFLDKNVEQEGTTEAVFYTGRARRRWRRRRYAVAPTQYAGSFEVNAKEHIRRDGCQACFYQTHVLTHVRIYVRAYRAQLQASAVFNQYIWVLRSLRDSFLFKYCFSLYYSAVQMMQTVYIHILNACI